MNKTIQEVSIETLRIENYINTKKQGEEVPYKSIESDTGIVMDTRGKSFLRTALKRLKMPYETISGQGIRLCGAENAERIIANRVVKIDNQVKRSEKTTLTIRESDIYNQLHEDGKHRIDFLVGFFGSIRSFSNSAKKIFEKQKIKIGEKIS